MKYLFCLFLFLLLFSRPVYAVSKFTTTYDLSYKVEESGITTVTQNFQIKNNSSEFFPEEYSATIGKQEIGNIQAYDRAGNLELILNGEGDKRQIIVKFRRSQPGFGQTLNWTLSYQSNEIAQKHGQMWQIYIQKPDDKIEVDSYTIGLYVPKSFGDPVFIKPTPKSLNNIFTSNELLANGIYAGYFIGNGKDPFQIYDFKLTYRLHNPKIYPVETSVAIPGSTNYQEVLLESITPQPINVSKDPDGNWIAKFSLGPTENNDVVVKGSVIVNLKPKQEEINNGLLNEYLSPQRYWESLDPRIVAMSKNIKTPKEVYDLVLKTLKYDFSRAEKNISRLGASGILNNPKSAISLEFTDLFIALARAAKIPSREINGYAIVPGVNESLLSPRLHSWPEYYDAKLGTWVMVDPSWESATSGLDYFTVLDTSHVSFITRGINSTSPTPIGSYGIIENNSDSIQINYHKGDGINLEKPGNLTLRTNIPNNLTSGFDFKGKIFIDNNGPRLFKENNLEIQNSTFEIDPTKIKTDDIPPFGHIEIPFTISKSPWNSNSSDIITIRLAGFSKDYFVSQQPIFTNKYLLVIGGLTFLGLISIITQIIRGLFFQKQRRGNNIHRES